MVSLRDHIALKCSAYFVSARLFGESHERLWFQMRQKSDGPERLLNSDVNGRRAASAPILPECFAGKQAEANECEGNDGPFHMGLFVEFDAPMILYGDSILPGPF
jgi:hypothetical protein